MTNNPSISVLMPVLRPHPVYFREALESILSQTLADWELVIVEDPSESPAAAILAHFHDPRIRYQCNPQRTSLSDSLNLALALARAPLVARLDADDICEPDRLEQQCRFLGSHLEIDVLGSQITVIDQHGRTCGRRAYPLEHRSIREALPRFNPLAHPSVMFRRQAVLAAGGYQRKINEDYDLWSRMAHSGSRFANHSEALLRYRIHPEGLKASQLRAILRDTLEIKRRYWASEMGLRARARMLAECALLRLPPGLVLRLFSALHVRAAGSGEKGTHPCALW